MRQGMEHTLAKPMVSAIEYMKHKLVRTIREHCGAESSVREALRIGWITGRATQKLGRLQRIYFKMPLRHAKVVLEFVPGVEKHFNQVVIEED